MRGHEFLAHTADAGFRARAATLPGLFAESARALTDVAGASPAGEPQTWTTVELEADDLPGLAYAWLNELIGLSEVHRASVAAVDVEIDEGDAGGWSLHGRVGLVAAGAGLRQVKSATYHRLSVEHRRSGWTMEAYLDI